MLLRGRAPSALDAALSDAERREHIPYQPCALRDLDWDAPAESARVFGTAVARAVPTDPPHGVTPTWVEDDVRLMDRAALK